MRAEGGAKQQCSAAQGEGHHQVHACFADISLGRASDCELARLPAVRSPPAGMVGLTAEAVLIGRNRLPLTYT